MKVSGWFFALVQFWGRRASPKYVNSWQPDSFLARAISGTVSLPRKLFPCPELIEGHVVHLWVPRPVGFRLSREEGGKSRETLEGQTPDMVSAACLACTAYVGLPILHLWHSRK